MRDLPEKPSTPISEDDKIQENRRVELCSDNYEITKPVFASDTVRICNPPILRFKSKVNAEAGQLKWSIKTEQENLYEKEFDSSGNISSEIDWKIGENQSKSRVSRSL